MTFASRTSVWPVANVESAPLASRRNKPRLSRQQAQLGAKTSQEKNKGRARALPLRLVVGQPAPNSRPGHVLRLPRFLHLALRHRRPRRLRNVSRTLAGLRAEPRITVSLTLIQPGHPGIPGVPPKRHEPCCSRCGHALTPKTRPNPGHACIGSKARREHDAPYETRL